LDLFLNQLTLVYERLGVPKEAFTISLVNHLLEAFQLKDLFDSLVELLVLLLG